MCEITIDHSVSQVTEDRVAVLENCIEQHKVSEELLTNENREIKAQAEHLKILHEQDLVQLKRERQIKDQESSHWADARKQLHDQLIQRNNEIQEVRDRWDEELNEKNCEIRALNDQLRQATSQVEKKQQALSKELFVQKKTSADAQKRLQELVAEHHHCQPEVQKLRTQLDAALSNARDAQRKLQDEASAHRSLRRVVDSAIQDNKLNKTIVVEMAKAIGMAVGDIKHLRTH